MNLIESQTATLRLIRGRGIGPVTFYKLLDHHGSAGRAVNALEAEDGRLKPAPLAVVEKECKALEKMGAVLIFYSDDIYPEALKHIPDPPPVLAALGRLELLSTPMVAIVGARNASANGCRLAQSLAADLGQEGWGVASGLARGVDTAAHKGALAGGCGTIAVLGGGLDHIYPTENTDLFWRIAKEGLILAETPLGTKPTAQSFPRRNRIVSGLSAGVVVVEAARHSGSLITAQQAGEQGREVMAIPGHPSEPRSFGCNHLLRQGATLVSSADDILEAVKGFDHGAPAQHTPTLFTREDQPGLGLALPEETKAVFVEDTLADGEEKPLTAQILDALSPGQTLVDDVVSMLNVPESKLLATLTELELDGEIERLSGGYITLAQRHQNSEQNTK